MASELIGRIACPFECGFGAAHVKRRTDKGEGVPVFAYVYCPACQHTMHTKNNDRSDALVARSTLPVPVPVPVPVLPVAVKNKVDGWVFGGAA